MFAQDVVRSDGVTAVLELTFSAEKLCHGVAVSEEKKDITAQFVEWKECKDFRWCKENYEDVKAGKHIRRWWVQ